MQIICNQEGYGFQNPQLFDVIKAPATILDCTGDGCALAVVNNGLYLCDCEDSWNCHLCGNDMPFNNTFNYGDSLFFHFQQIDLLNIIENDFAYPSRGWDTGTPLCTARIFPCCGEPPIAGIITDYASNYMIGMAKKTKYDGSQENFAYQNIELDSSLIVDALDGLGLPPCFVIIFRFYTDVSGLNFYELCTEPFEMNNCNKSTVKIESSYPSNKRDCNGYYYGTPFQRDDDTLWYLGNSPLAYRNIYRFEGEIEKISESYTKEVIKNTLNPVKSQLCSTYRVASYPLPPYAMNIVANVFNGSPIWINDKVYQIISEISKNNETGRMWLMDTEVQSCCNEIDLSCNT
tara:strand:+ start:6135 stop:7175 length:1041 start_codon:yes stop_codon:yes gene_type:complete